MQSLSIKHIILNLTFQDGEDYENRKSSIGP